MRITPCIEPVGASEKEYFRSTRIRMVEDDLKYWREKFKKYESQEGRVDGDLYDKDGLFSSLQDFARHIRQVEWLLKELEKVMKN